MNTTQRGTLLILLSFTIVSGIFSFCSGNLPAADEKPNQTRLMMVDADGSNLRELFRSDEYTVLGSPAISPDGKKIAMDGKANRGTRILVIDADGTNLKDLGEGMMPTWSSDSKKLTFTRPRPIGVVIMNADGTNREPLDSRGRGAQWSPDGTMIIYVERSSRGVGHLKIYNTQEDTFRYVFPFEKNPYSHYYSNFCWSPDSKSICFKGRGRGNRLEIVTVEINKGLKGLKVHYYDDPERNPSNDYAWHPGGNKIACTLQLPRSKIEKIFFFNPLNKQGMKMLPGQKDQQCPEDLCWTPDGEKLIFTCKLSGQ